MTEVSARRAQTRLALIKAATRVFALRGIDASVEELCEAAGFSRGAFYSNFDTRNELCLAVLEHYGRHDIESFSSAISFEDDGGDRDQTIDRAIDRFIELWWGREPDVLLALHQIQLAARREPELREAAQRLSREMQVPLMELMTRAFTQRGMAFRVPMDEALAIMRAVYLGALVDAGLSERINIPLIRHRLVTVLKVLLEPED